MGPLDFEKVPKKRHDFPTKKVGSPKKKSGPNAILSSYVDHCDLKVTSHLPCSSATDGFPEILEDWDPVVDVSVVHCPMAMVIKSPKPTQLGFCETAPFDGEILRVLHAATFQDVFFQVAKSTIVAWIGHAVCTSSRLRVRFGPQNLYFSKSQSFTKHIPTMFFRRETWSGFFTDLFPSVRCKTSRFVERTKSQPT